MYRGRLVNGQGKKKGGQRSLSKFAELVKVADELFVRNEEENSLAVKTIRLISI